MSDDWQRKLTTERMQVDQEFEDQLAASEFSRQQWSLIMTAVEFDITDPEDPESARLVADTDKLPSIMSELDRLDDRGAVPGAGGSSGGGGDGSGLLGNLKSALGMGGASGGGKQLAAAEELAQEYADDLQAKLEQRGKWESIRAEASGE
jgi:hypothetical protein